MKIKGKLDKFLLIPIILFSIYLLIRIIDQAKIINNFPLDANNDIISFMAMMFFFAKCGWNHVCPYWYGGVLPFINYSPGWFILTMPIYLLTNNILVTMYISLISLYLVGILAFYILGKTQKLSFIKTSAFFLFFFGMPVAIGNFIKLGRLPEMFAWIIFTFLAILIFWYKNHKIDKKFYLFIPLYFLTLISHQQETLLSHILILSLFLIKGIKDKIKIGVSMVIGALMASFWLVPYISNLLWGTLSTYPSEGIRLFSFDKANLLTNITSFIIPIVLFVTFYFYWKDNKKSKTELLFFSPILILAIGFLFRLTPFIPIFKEMTHDPFILFFLFFSLFFFLKTDFKIYNPSFSKLILFIVILASIVLILVSSIYTPFFKVSGDLEKEAISLLPYINNKFVFLTSPTNGITYYTYYAYANINYNLTVAGGYAPHMVNYSYNLDLFSLNNLLKDKNCTSFNNISKKLDIREVVSSGEDCELLRYCGLKEKIKKETFCLYEFA